MTEVLGLDPDRLWVTVHTTDDEAEAIWRDVVGVPAERIQRLDEDNFWQMADTGPCGPCSEIFWDKGPEYGEAGGPAHGGEERFVEIWNLVFMQYDQHADGTRCRCPSPASTPAPGSSASCAVLQGVDSVFDTDELPPPARQGQRAHRRAPTASDERTRRLPAHPGRPRPHDDLPRQRRGHPLQRGAGLRPAPHHPPRGPPRLPARRRATSITPALVDEVVAIMGDDYPELVESHAFVRQTIEREETRFRETLRTGSAILETALDKLGPRRGPAGRRRLPAPRHLRVPARGHPGDRGRAGRRRSTRPASTPPWPSSASGPRPAAQGAGAGPTPTTWTCPRPSFVGRERERGRHAGARRRSGDDGDTRDRARPARRSTPSPVARSATPARSPPTPAGPGHRHHLRPARRRLPPRRRSTARSRSAR